MTATTRPHTPRRSWAMMAARRTLRTIRYLHEELERASEAMIRSARAPQPGPPATSTASRGGVATDEANVRTGRDSAVIGAQASVAAAADGAKPAA